MPKQLLQLGRILSTEGELQALSAKARDLRVLGAIVGGFLPPQLAREARVANIREGELILVAATAAAGAKLRLLAPALNRFLLERRKQVSGVRIRVQPKRPHSGPCASQKTATLSTHTLNSLLALHNGMVPSPARDALRRLLRRQGVDAIELPPQTATAGTEQSQEGRA